MSRKNGVITPSTFVRRARKYVGGEIHFFGTDVRSIRGPIAKVERRGDEVRVTCKWLAAHFPGRSRFRHHTDKGKWKLRRYSHFDISLKHPVLMGGENRLGAYWPMPPWIGGGGYVFYSKDKDMLKRSAVIG